MTPISDTTMAAIGIVVFVLAGFGLLLICGWPFFVGYAAAAGVWLLLVALAVVTTP